MRVSLSKEKPVGGRHFFLCDCEMIINKKSKEAKGRSIHKHEFMRAASTGSSGGSKDWNKR
jgi:hypothetical protein